MPFSCLTVYDDILSWSNGCPPWQCDTLRRLFQKGQLDDNDIDEILSLCKSQHQIVDATALNIRPIPLDQTHISCQPTIGGDPVMLISMSDLKNINAITSHQPLTFSQKGLSIIYGDNGAGKSGYVRVLKKACRARHTERNIHPNVFSPTSGTAQTARISYQQGTMEVPFDWEKDRPAPEPLSAVNVFDTGCASVYVNEQNDIAYTPLGLDIFTKLVAVCDTIKRNLASEKAELRSRLDVLPVEHRETLAGKWFEGISAMTTEESVTTNASFSKAEDEELEDIRKILSEQTKRKRASELRMKKERYSKLYEHLQNAEKGLSAEALRLLKDTRQRLDTAIKSALLITSEAFADEPLKGVGTDAWRELWNAAKTYSETQAYQGLEFPYTGRDSKCVLCFQDLEEHGEQRLKKFRDYVRGETAERERKAREAFEAAKSDLISVELQNENDEVILKELAEDDAMLADMTSEFISRGQLRKGIILESCEHGLWQQDIPGIPEHALTRLTAVCERLEALAKSFEEAEDPEVLKKRQLKLNELEARKWVSDRRETIMAEINRKKLVAKYNYAISETDTTQITKTSTQLTDKHVTEELRKRFLNYLKTICHQGISVSLEKKQGGKGKTYYHLHLTNCTAPGTPVCDIISEGEFRAVALAAFLAEISLSPTRSGVVFDDPVSSFDHLIRERVAAQLVELAKERQVIVFTHDLFFLVTLSGTAERHDVSVNPQMIIRDYKGPGACSPGVPWDAMKFKARLKDLAKRVDDAETKYKTEGRPGYELAVDQVCKKLRQAIERAIEEVLLLGIVQRYRRSIHATKVRQLSKIKKDDCMLLDELMTEYSKYEHDQTFESSIPMPEPARLREDIEKLQQWAKEFSDRRETDATV